MITFRLWGCIILLSSCSAPRYTYYFDHQHPAPRTESKPMTSRIILAPDELFASNDKVLKVTGKQLKTDRSWQTHVPEPRWGSARVARENREVSLQPTKSDRSKMEPDLKRSIIFGISGIVALIIGGQVFWVLGSLSLLIGLIFGVKWLLRH